MDATQAIADLTEISPQVKHVVVVGADGSLVGSNLPSEDAAARLAAGAQRLLDAAEDLRPGVSQLEAATVLGSVFCVRDGGRLIAAATTPEPTVGLVFYDLKTCLRSITDVGSTESAGAKAAASPAPERGSSESEPEPEPKPKATRRAPAKKKEDGDAAA